MDNMKYRNRYQKGDEGQLNQPLTPQSRRRHKKKMGRDGRTGPFWAKFRTLVRAWRPAFRSTQTMALQDRTEASFLIVFSFARLLSNFSSKIDEVSTPSEKVKSGTQSSEHKFSGPRTEKCALESLIIFRHIAGPSYLTSWHAPPFQVNSDPIARWDITRLTRSNSQMKAIWISAVHKLVLAMPVRLQKGLFSTVSVTDSRLFPYLLWRHVFRPPSKIILIRSSPII